MAYDNGEVVLHAGHQACASPIIDEEGNPVLDKHGQPKRRIVETTVGRVLIAEVLPKGVAFEYANKTLDKKALSALIDVCYRVHRNKETVLLADRLRTLGFDHAMRAGISICMDHMVIPRREEGPPRRGAEGGRARRRAVPGRPHHRRRALQQDRRHLGRRRRRR